MTTIAENLREHHLAMVQRLIFTINRLDYVMRDLEKDLKKHKRLLKKANRCIA